MALATASDLAAALAAVSPTERRAVLTRAEQLRREQCASDGPPIEPVDIAAARRSAGLAKALADPVRVGLFDTLRRHGGAVCQCDLQPLFDLAQPTLSHHLRKLVAAGLVDVERRGRWAYYSTNDQALEELKTWLT